MFLYIRLCTLVLASLALATGIRLVMMGPGSNPVMRGSQRTCGVLLPEKGLLDPISSG